jgi:hypothetical protein
VIIPVRDTYLQVRVLSDINGVLRVVRIREQLRSLSTSRLRITNPHAYSYLLLVQACGGVVQLVRTTACHGRGLEFESRRPRHS